MGSSASFEFSALVSGQSSIEIENLSLEIMEASSSDVNQSWIKILPGTSNCIEFPEGAYIKLKDSLGNITSLLADGVRKKVFSGNLQISGERTKVTISDHQSSVIDDDKIRIVKLRNQSSYPIKYQYQSYDDSLFTIPPGGSLNNGFPIRQDIKILGAEEIICHLARHNKTQYFDGLVIQCKQITSNKYGYRVVIKDDSKFITSIVNKCNDNFTTILRSGRSEIIPPNSFIQCNSVKEIATRNGTVINYQSAAGKVNIEGFNFEIIPIGTTETKVIITPFGG